MAEKAEPVVDVASGKIQGVLATSALGTKYYSFQGIPYAQPPIGNLRFKDPVPVTPWKHILTCNPPNFCPQREMIQRTIIGNEDCLTLSVYTKQIDLSNKPIPVMVYIHGGAFLRGSSRTDTYGPDYLIEKDIVLVTLNYRLGPFGFLSFEDPALEIPGNAGLKDQVLALKWVKTNIAQFGGDVNNITLFGESAGACSAHMHMLSPMSKGLFHKVILQSGCALNNWSISPSRGLRLAKEIGWDGEGGEKEALQYLLKEDAHKLAELQDNLLTKEDVKNYNLFPFGPVIEPYRSDQCFIPSAIQNMIKQSEPDWGWGINLPLIAGFNSDEGLYLYKAATNNPDFFEQLAKHFTSIVPQELELTDSKVVNELSLKIKDFYFGEKDLNVENIDCYIKIMTDKLFLHGIHRTIKHHKGPVFAYRFAVDSQTNNQYKLLFCGNVKGTAHADDLFYLFKSKIGKIYEPGTLEQRTIELMTTSWTNFATSGSPNPTGANIEWKEHQGDKYFLNIDDTVTLETTIAERERMAFWDNLYKNANVNL